MVVVWMEAIKRQRKEYFNLYRQNHLEKCREKNRRYYKNHKDRVYQYKENKKMEYKQYFKMKNRQDSQELKIKVMTHYGNGIPACVICGESRLDCLSIDHINGNGNKHRKEILKVGGGIHFYRWLVKNGFPEGYRTLCMNDQFIEKHKQRI